MPGGQDILDRVKERHVYDAWRGTNTLPENLFVWHFFLRGDELASWKIESVQQMEPPSMPPMLQSVWKRADNGAMLLVDTYECASRQDAHEFLVRLLTQFQSPLVTRRQEVQVGDVAFGSSEQRASAREGILLFARANLVNMIRRGSQTPVSVTDLAAQFDSRIFEKPETPTFRALAAAEPEEAREVRVGETVPLDISMDERPPTAFSALRAAGPGEREYTPPARLYKCFSANGEVLKEEGRLAYRPSAEGPQTVTVYGVDPSGKADRQDIRFVAT